MEINNTIYNTFWISVYLIVFVFLLTFIILGVASCLRKRKEKETQYNLTFFQVLLPSDNEIEIKAAEHMFSNLVGFKKGFWKALFTGQYRISFEIVSKAEGTAFYVVTPDEIASLVEKQINAAYPTAQVDIVKPHEIWDRGKHTRIAELKLRGPAFYPIKQYEDLKNDSLSPITSAMSKMKVDQVTAVQYIIQPADDNWRLAGRKFISNARAVAANPDKKMNIDEKFLEGVENKISNPGFNIKIRIVSVADDRMVADSQMHNMIGAFEQFTDVTYNRFVKRFLFSPKKYINDFIYRRLRIKNIAIPMIGIQVYSNVSVLNNIEMATVFHFPNKDIGTPNILWLVARKSSAPIELPEEGIYLGKSVFRGIEKKVHMLDEDRT